MLNTQQFKEKGLSATLGSHPFTCAFTCAFMVAATLMTSGSLAAEESEADAAIEEVVVTGIRGSLRYAQDIKRDADSVVEAITFEDLGKFSDENIADALQRVPGLQVDRNDTGTGGDRLSIRGLGPQFVTTTVNGRTTLSSGSEGIGNLRVFNLDLMPPEILSGVLVHKTPTANIVESGLGGSVDLQTLRPLDTNFNGRDHFLAFNAVAEHDELADRTGPRISGIWGGKFADNTLGISLAALWSETERRRNQQSLRELKGNVNIDENENGVLDDDETHQLFFPRMLVQNPIEEARERNAFSGVVQFRPHDRFELTADVTYSEFTNNSFRQNYRSFNNTVFNGLFHPDSIVVEEDTVRYFNLRRDLDGDGNLGDGYTPAADNNKVIVQTASLLFDNHTETLLGGLNANWIGDRLAIDADLSFSSVDYEQDLRSPRYRAFDLDQDAITYDAHGDVVQQTFGKDFDEPASYANFNAAVREFALEGDQWALSLNFDYDLSDGNALQFGVRHASMELTSDPSRFHVIPVPEEQAEAFVKDGLDGRLVTKFMDGTEISTTEFLGVNFDGAAAAFTPLATTTGEDIPRDKLAAFKLEEATTAFYSQLNLGGEWGRVPYTSNLGLRAVYTDNTGSGVVIGQDGVVSPVDDNTNYWELLPSANINFELHDDVNFRLGVSRVISRPNPTDLAPRISIAADDDPEVSGTARAGNIHLDPYSAWQFDATLEWYTPNDGAVVLSAFYKDVQDFILTSPTAFQGSLPGQDGTFNIIAPVNFSDGTLYGFEAGFNQPFTALPAPFDGLGLQANYTYIKSEFDEDVGDGGFGFPGASENNFNAVLYYEKHGLGVRLAYVFRDDFFRALSTSQTDGLQQFSEAEHQLNLNISYSFLDNFEANFSVVNLTESERRDFRLSKDNFQGYFERGRLMLFGLRFKF